MKNSKLYRLNNFDLIKAAVMLFISSVVGGLVMLLDSGHLPTSWNEVKPIVIIAAYTMASYILKQLFTNGDTTTNP